MKFANLSKISLLDKLFLSIIVLNVINYFLFEKTLIPLKIIVSLFLIGVIAYFIFGKSNLFKRVGILESIIYCMIICGSYFTFIFLSLNFFFSSPTTEVSTFKVKCKINTLLNTEEQDECPKVVKVDFPQGFQKRIGISEKIRHHKIHPDSLDIYLSDGLFGVHVIKRVEFNKPS